MSTRAKCKAVEGKAAGRGELLGMARRIATVLGAIALVLSLTAVHAATPQAVVIQDLAYHPEPVVVAQGAVVVFANADALSFAHTASYPLGCQDDCAWTTPFLDITQPAATVTIDLEPGIYLYGCRVHPFMLGTMIVTP